RCSARAIGSTASESSRSRTTCSPRCIAKRYGLRVFTRSALALLALSLLGEKFYHLLGDLPVAAGELAVMTVPLFGASGEACKLACPAKQIIRRRIERVSQSP